jgi:hypothetical protein
MDLKRSLRTFMNEHLIKISKSDKKIQYFINFLEQIEKIINKNELECFLNHSPQLIRNEFLKDSYSEILNEILINFNHPDLFIETEQLNEVKHLLTNIIIQSNYVDTFRVLLRLSSTIK